MKQEFIRNPYNYDSDELSEDTGLRCLDESLTEQDFVEESDINYIAEKFLRTGMAPVVVNMPTYGDFGGIFDFQSAMNIINAAKTEFMNLPAKIRTRFNNDPQQLLDFVEDPTNRDEAEKLGFIIKRDTIEPQSNLKENTDGRQSGRTTQDDEEEGKGPARTQATPQKGQGTERP